MPPRRSTAAVPGPMAATLRRAERAGVAAGVADTASSRRAAPFGEVTTTQS